MHHTSFTFTMKYQGHAIPATCDLMIFPEVTKGLYKYPLYRVSLDMPDSKENDPQLIILHEINTEKGRFLWHPIAGHTSLAKKVMKELKDYHSPEIRKHAPSNHTKPSAE